MADTEDAPVVAEIDEEDADATPDAAADLLIEVDDETDDTTSDVVGQDRDTDGAL